MDFSFADISSVFTTMLQPVAPDSGMARTGEMGPKNTVFAEKLTRTLKKESSEIQPARPARTMEKLIAEIAQSLEKKTGAESVAALKKVLQALSNNQLDALSLDSSGLEAFKKLLIKAGFSQSDLEALIAELLADSESAKLDLDAFFDRLIELSPDKTIDDESGDAVFLEMSALPFIESILISLGIDKEKIQQVLVEADGGKKGVNLDTLLESLKQIQKTAFYHNTRYQAPEGDTHILDILNQMGAETSRSNKTDFATSLDDVVAALDTLRKRTLDAMEADGSHGKSALKPTAAETPSELLITLLKGLKSTHSSETKSILTFSADQVSEPFKDSMAFWGEKRLDTGTSASGESLKSGSSSVKVALKELAAFFGEKKDASASETNVLNKEGQGLAKNSGSRASGSSDAFQFSASDIKAKDGTPSANAVKSNAPARPLPAHVTHQVSKSLVRAIDQGENLIRIQLKPPELGRLMMTIDNSGNTLKVSIVTETLAARDILTSTAVDLKSVLSSSGVTLERFEVDMNADFRQSMADARHQADQFSRRRQNREKGLAGISTAENSDSATGLSGVLNPDGSLHFVA